MIDGIELDGFVRLSHKSELPCCPGIYFVVTGTKILYIGQSVNLRYRWANHHRIGEFQKFDCKIGWIKADEQDNLGELEKKFIVKHKPSLNNTLSAEDIKQRTIPLSPEIWQRFDKLAEDTNSFAQRGTNAGQPSWRNLMRRIAASPDILEIIKHYFNSQSLGYTSDLPQVVVVRPESPKTNTIAWLYLQGETVSVNFPEKRDDFRGVVKSLGYTWDRPYWQREIGKLAGKPADRCAELGHYLLASGFCVVFPSADIRDMAIAASYEPEQKRWVLVRTNGDYKHWFALKWRYSEDCYAEAMKLSGARYSKPSVVVPPENFEEVEDFASIHGFEFSDAALEILEQVKAWRESAMVVSLDEIVDDKLPAERPDLEMPEDVEIDDDLADDYDAA